MSWRESVIAEVNDEFVSNPFPTIGETITVSLRCRDSADIVAVHCRFLSDGESRVIDCAVTRRGGWLWALAPIIITQPELRYQFIFCTGNDYHFFSRRGVSHIPPAEEFDFVILADLHYPAWVPSTVFYQIFPDRFRMASADDAVITDEYTYDGFATRRMNWGDDPLPYEQGGCVDFFGGDLDGIVDAIPYLRNLGVGALYLNPIFAARTNHGYDTINYGVIDPHKGGNEGLSRLTTAMHANQMRVILDISINHVGSDHHWYQEALQGSRAAEFFTFVDGEPTTWEGFKTLLKLNYTSQTLRDAMYRSEDSVLKSYLREPYSIDGWRLDVGHNTAREGQVQLGHEVFREVRSAVKSVNREAYIVGEQWLDPRGYLNGDQWDATMNYLSSARALRRFAGGSDRFATVQENPESLWKPYTGRELGEIIAETTARIPNQLSFLQFNLLDSHDIYRFHNHDGIFSESLYRGILALLYLIPGTVSIYYGDEIGLRGSMVPNEGCRFPMEWEDSKQNRARFDLYRKLNALKKNEAALQIGAWKILHADDSVLVFSRIYKDRGFIAVVSNSPASREVGFPVCILGDSRESAVDVLTGEEAEIAGDGYVRLTLEPFGARLFGVKFSFPA